MPLYDFYSSKTKKTEEHLVKLVDYDQFLKDNPHLRREYTPVALVDSSRLGHPKLPSDFKNGVIDRINRDTKKAKLHGAKNSDLARRGSRFSTNMTEI